MRWQRVDHVVSEVLDRVGSTPAYAVAAPLSPSAAATSAAASPVRGAGGQYRLCRAGRRAAVETPAGEGQPAKASRAAVSPGSVGPARLAASPRPRPPAPGHLRGALPLKRTSSKDLSRTRSARPGKGNSGILPGEAPGPLTALHPPGPRHRRAGEDRDPRPPAPRPGSCRQSAPTSMGVQAPPPPRSTVISAWSRGQERVSELEHAHQPGDAHASASGPGLLLACGR